jgi:hypothetical protein
MNTPKSRMVDANTAEFLLRDRNGQIDSTLRGRTTTRRYILDDGGALVLSPDGSGRHWESYRELMNWVEALDREAHTGSNMLHPLLPLADEFIRHIPELVTSLPRLLRVDPASLDGTEESIAVIDIVVDELGSGHFSTPDVFQSVVAYVGEVIRRRIDGSWDVQLGQDGRTWEPDIIDRYGKKCSLLRLYNEILEHGEEGEEGDLSAFVRHTIRTHVRP